MEGDLPEQTLGHIQHTCDALSTAHIDTHCHQLRCLIHGELARLASPAWNFICNSGEKCLQTIWDELSLEMEDLEYLNITQDTIWNAARVRELTHPLTLEDSKRILEDQSRETLAKERF